ncbi:translation initiation factor IF-2-like [Anastrepha ludens]|uniref:translation initiation factor IF-2-like n=1 Tax=Anastrepha ludens TaxID=28586 RepID=UPI0023B04427|nr:translation initiation factor IF-2-like [Anastrepha ludens]
MNDDDDYAKKMQPKYAKHAGKLCGRPAGCLPRSQKVGGSKSATKPTPTPTSTLAPADSALKSAQRERQEDVCSALPFAALFLTSIANECLAHNFQPGQPPFNTNSWPHPVYGVPPPSQQTPCANRAPVQAPTHVPILTAVVRPIGPIGKNYEVKLSQSSQLNLERRLPISEPAKLVAAVINGPLSHQTDNNQFADGPKKYLPPPHPMQPKPYYQPLTGVPGQQYGNAAAGANIPYTPNYNPLLPQQYSQPTPPTSLTPPPPPPPAPAPAPSSETFYNQGSKLQHQYFTSAQENKALGISGGAANSGAQYQPPVDNSVNGVAGNYISQSEVGKLSHYVEKQNPVGDTRPYSRLIHTCYPDGHCERQQLSAGQTDPRHQHIVLTARARVQPISDKCRTLAAQGGVQTALDSGSLSQTNPLRNTQNRPPNRRLYQYTEAVIPRDTFN